MMRALWTAASGMIGQQTNLDTIANNLSNISTTGYKTQAANFKTLIYQNLQKVSTTTTGAPKPVGAQVGLGVRVGSISSDFTQGNLNTSNGPFDYAIQGEGFFMVQMDDGTTAYTRNGHFDVSLSEDGLALTDSSGRPVLDINGNPIVIPATYRSSRLGVDQYGSLTYPDANNNQQYLGIQIGLAYFPNASGLEKGSGSNYLESPASGVPTIYNAGALNSKIVSGYLESSNVQAADEMVNMIIAQRAYEMNSKAITASDEMLQQANNLRS
ncbi:MAG: flagellar hook-basal body protein [Lachnospiraceae bacterium]|nr:flagellar hook-basal body protein [Lachnospiraceae bacterium]